MIPQTQKQRDNTVHALRHMWPSVPPKNVSRRLNSWRGSENWNRPTTCETIACFGGFCEGYPGFREQVNWQDTVHTCALQLFGDESLFGARDDHPADEGFTGTDHELVTHRLEWVLKNSEVVA